MAIAVKMRLCVCSSRRCQLENAQIQVNENGRNSNYGLCKLDYIEFGRALSL